MGRKYLTVNSSDDLGDISENLAWRYVRTSMRPAKKKPTPANVNENAEVNHIYYTSVKHATNR